jgi:hypothetical protein
LLKATQASNLKYFDKIDLRRLTKLALLLPKFIKTLKTFTGPSRWMEMNQGDSFLPTSLQNGILRGPTLQVSDNIVRIYKVFPHLLQNNTAIRARFLVHFTKQNIWQTTKYMPTLFDCQDAEGVKACRVRMPRDSNSRCGHLLNTNEIQVEQACSVSLIRSPTFMSLACPAYRIAGLIVKGMQVRMLCRDGTFDYDLPQGTALIPAECSLVDSKDAPLYVALNPANIVNKPLINTLGIKTSSVNRILRKETDSNGLDVLSYYQQDPTTEKAIVAATSGWDFNPLSITLISLASIIFSTLSLVAVCMCITKFRLKKLQEQCSAADSQGVEMNTIPTPESSIFKPTAPMPRYRSQEKLALMYASRPKNAWPKHWPTGEIDMT